MHTKKTLCDVKGLSEPKIDKIRDAALKIVGTGFITGTEARQRRQTVFHVSTGSVALNELIGGGIESGSITEAFGMFCKKKGALFSMLHNKNEFLLTYGFPFLLLVFIRQGNFVVGRRNCRTLFV